MGDRSAADTNKVRYVIWAKTDLVNGQPHVGVSPKLLCQYMSYSIFKNASQQIEEHLKLENHFLNKLN